MKALGLGIAAALVLATAPVMAADLVVDVPDDALVTAASDWDGAYAGIGGIVYASTAPSTGYGIVGTLGVNQTVNNNFLIGAEVYGGIANDSVGGVYFQLGAEGRGGLLVSDAVLLYGAVGLEYDSGAPAETYGTFGGGVEFALADNMTLDVEYKHFAGINVATHANQVGVSLNFGF